MTDEHTSQARERVLQAAEQLFSERGYNAVTLRDIASKLNIKAASLYNHAPGGKEELYVTVMERNLRRHQRGIEDAIQSNDELRSQLRAIAGWLIAQPPLNLERMNHADLPALESHHAKRLSTLLFQSTIKPIHEAVLRATAHNGVMHERAGMLAGTFLVAVQSFRDLERYTGEPQHALAEQLIDLLLNGLDPR